MAVRGVALNGTGIPLYGTGIPLIQGYPCMTTVFHIEPFWLMTLLNGHNKLNSINIEICKLATC